MARPLLLTITESSEELQRRLQHKTDARQQERLQMLYWLKQGLVHSRPQIAQLLHRNESTITRWLNAYRQGGLKQLLAVKMPPGAARIISPAVMAQLQERLQDPSGFDSYSAIVQWLRHEHQLEVAYPTVHRIVRYELGAKLKVPRPRHQQQAQGVTEDLKKLPVLLQVLQAVIGSRKLLRYFCQDESRWGLLTLTGRRVTLPLYQWRRPTFWLYGVVEPLTGEHFFQVYDQLNGRAFQDFIETFAARYPDAVLVVQMAQAAAHRANTMNWPPNVVPVFAPEVNPIERLWQHLRAALAWQSFETLEALQQKLQAVLSQMTAAVIRSLTGWSFITQPLLTLSSN